ncbi:MAG: 30S ribosomal protein S4e [Candidatus Aenigmatarchaeota archaeon]
MTKHQKAISSPKTFPIKRKGNTWTTNPRAGPHSQKDCIPLGVLIRDMLGYAESIKEVRKILNKGYCKVDGKICKDYKYPIGIFDSIELKDEHYRIMPSKKGFGLLEIDEKESQKKICRLEDKTLLKGGKTQLNLNDGKNIITEDGEDLETGTSLIISLPDLEIEETVDREEGNKVMIVGGKNRGKIAEFKKVKEVKGSKPNRVIVTREDKEINLPEGLVFPVGKKESIIQIE